MTKNATDSMLMVRPARFSMNDETIGDNFYQQKPVTPEASQNEHAQHEFDAFVAKLKQAGVHVFVIQDSKTPHTPDSVFPNNWISMHPDGRTVLYPMMAQNRRSERLSNIDVILADFGFYVREIVDYTAAEQQEIFHEGTGAMILDHDSMVVYMAKSHRSSTTLLHRFCDDFGYTPVIFTAYQSTDQGRMPIYHTNVMMCITDQYAVICLDAIDDAEERAAVEQAILKTNKSVLEISESQVNEFAGNMLLVKGKDDQLFLVMSSRAYRSLDQEQIGLIEKHHTILHSDLSTIENMGGGSARCMLAEIYLPKK
jgi:hypothetical protein